MKLSFLEKLSYAAEYARTLAFPGPRGRQIVCVVAHRDDGKTVSLHGREVPEDIDDFRVAMLSSGMGGRLDVTYTHGPRKYTVMYYVRPGGGRIEFPPARTNFRPPVVRAEAHTGGTSFDVSTRTRECAGEWSDFGASTGQRAIARDVVGTRANEGTLVIHTTRGTTVSDFSEQVSLI